MTNLLRRPVGSIVVVATVVSLVLVGMSWSASSAADSDCPCTIWEGDSVPQTASERDPEPVEVGVKFRSDIDGVITGVRFYKGPLNTGTHTGSLWGQDGQLLARAAFSQETESGWQQVTFDEPVPVSADTMYVASYHTTSGGYAISEYFFSESGVENGPLSVPRSGERSGNGVYKYSGSPAFPNETWNASNYWVDVVFAESGDSSPPTNTPDTDPTPTNTPEPTATNTPDPEPTATNTPDPEPTPTNTPEPEPTTPPSNGTTSDPTLVASYTIPNTDVYSYDWVRYQPRQFVAGKAIDPVGGDTVSNPGAYAGWDVLNSPDPPDNGSSGFFGRVYSTNNLISVTLNRPAEMAIVWRAGGQTPSWLSSWSNAGTVGINGQNRQVYTKSFPAGEVTLGGVWDGGGTGSTQRLGYYVLTAESGGTPSATPAVPNGQATPQPNQACPAWVHDQYVATGPDGNTYPTWHAQIDPVFWCYFGHEHGSDPSYFDPDYKPVFGYTATTMGMSEPHAGFKVYVGESNGYQFLMTQHFGTAGLGRACVAHHTLDIAMKNSGGEIVSDLHLMGDFGPAVFNRTGQAFTPPDCPDQAQEASGSTGVRRLPSAHDYVAYEPWRVGNTGSAVGLRGTITINTFDSMVICNNLNCDQPHVTGASGTQRAIEEFYNVGVRNSPNSGVFYTDPQGDTVLDAADPEAVKQYVAPGASVDMGSVVCRDFDGWGQPYTCGGNVGNQPFPPAERENSIKAPN